MPVYTQEETLLPTTGHRLFPSIAPYLHLGQPHPEDDRRMRPDYMTDTQWKYCFYYGMLYSVLDQCGKADTFEGAVQHMNKLQPTLETYGVYFVKLKVINEHVSLLMESHPSDDGTREYDYPLTAEERADIRGHQSVLTLLMDALTVIIRRAVKNDYRGDLPRESLLLTALQNLTGHLIPLLQALETKYNVRVVRPGAVRSEWPPGLVPID